MTNMVLQSQVDLSLLSKSEWKDADAEAATALQSPETVQWLSAALKYACHALWS